MHQISVFESNFQQTIQGSFYSNRFSQVPGTVHVAASLHSEVVREKLHGDHCQDPLESVHRFGNLQGVLGPLASLCVALLDDDDGLAISSSHLNRLLSHSGHQTWDG